MDKYDKAVEAAMKLSRLEIHDAWQSPTLSNTGAEPLFQWLSPVKEGGLRSCRWDEFGSLTTCAFMNERDGLGLGELPKEFRLNMDDLLCEKLTISQLLRKYKIRMKKREWLELFAKWQRKADRKLKKIEKEKS